KRQKCRKHPTAPHPDCPDCFCYEDVKITDIKPGDEILSLNEETGEFVPARVVNLKPMPVQASYLLITQSRKRIRTSAEHPYLAIKKQSRKGKGSLSTIFEVDQSGRLEKNENSVVALANQDQAITISLDKKTKQQVARRHYSGYRKRRYLGPDLFAALIIEAIERTDLPVTTLVIDEEYPQHETRITETLLTVYPALTVFFKYLGRKHSYAHSAAWAAKTRKKPAFASSSLKVMSSSDLSGSLDARSFAPRNGYRRVQNDTTRAPNIPAPLDMSSGQPQWTETQYLQKGMRIATVHGWESIVNVYPMGTKEPMWDIEIENTHNFVGNDIVAHNTYIDSNASDTVALDIDAENTTTDVLNLAATVLTTGRAIDIPDLDALTTGTGLNLVSNSSNTSERYLVNIDNDNTAATGTRLLRLKQDAAQTLALLDQNGNGLTIDIDSEATTADILNIQGTVLTTGRAIDLPDLDALTTGTGLNIYSDSDSSSERYLVNIHQGGNDASNARALRIRQDAAQDAVLIQQNDAGDALFIDQDSATGTAINIDAENTTTDVLNIAATVLTTGRAIDLPDLDALTTGTGLNVVSNSSNTSERYLVNIHQDHASASSAVGLRIQQDASADILRLYQSTTSVFSISSGGQITIAAPLTANTTALCWDNSGNSIIYDCDGSATDLAENFGTTDTSIGAGDIVTVDRTRNGEVMTVYDDAGNPIVTSKAWITKATLQDKVLLGVVSTQPNELYGDDGVFDPDENPRPVSLAGRLPVKVSGEGGPIAPGDRIAPSSEPGIGRKAQPGEPTVGIALEQFTGSQGTLLAYLDLDESADASAVLAEHGNALASLGLQLDTQGQELASLEQLIGTNPQALAVESDGSTAVIESILSRLAQLEAAPAAPGSQSDSAELAGASTSSSDAPSYLTSAIFSGPLVFSGGLTVEQSVEVIGELEVHADVSLYANLIVDAVHVAHALNVHGDTTLFGNLTVEGETTVKGELSLSQQQAGFATIPRGGQQVEVHYIKPFNKTPLVQLTPVDTRVAFGLAQPSAAYAGGPLEESIARTGSPLSNYWISAISPEGFTITLAEVASYDVSFNWTTLSVEAPAIHQGRALDSDRDGVIDIDEPPVPASKLVEPSPTPTPQPDSAASQPLASPALPLPASPEPSPSPLPLEARSPLDLAPLGDSRLFAIEPAPSPSSR
ncbi:MAG: hypothetical protein HY372_02360, partial [Candidatus Andersenbacteria bacterium]|nr:hypothetical protein [Candidatus Andersenbacteria bacterium]